MAKSVSSAVKEALGMSATAKRDKLAAELADKRKLLEQHRRDLVSLKAQAEAALDDVEAWTAATKAAEAVKYGADRLEQVIERDTARLAELERAVQLEVLTVSTSLLDMSLTHVRTRADAFARALKALHVARDELDLATEQAVEQRATAKSQAAELGVPAPSVTRTLPYSLGVARIYLTGRELGVRKLENMPERSMQRMITMPESDSQLLEVLRDAYDLPAVSLVMTARYPVAEQIRDITKDPKVFRARYEKELAIISAHEEKVQADLRQRDPITGEITPAERARITEALDQFTEIYGQAGQ